MWRMRYLKYYCKIVILKLLVVSQINYVANVIPIPNSIDTKINKMMFSFVWGLLKKEGTKNICLNTITEGDLDMVGLQAKVGSLQLSLIRRFFDDEKATWKIIFPIGK